MSIDALSHLFLFFWLFSALTVPLFYYTKHPFWCESESLSCSAVAAKSLQSCPTLCDPLDGSPLGSSVPGILQARILESVAISFSS